MALAAPMTLTAAAMLPPPALASTVYSPSARHPVEAIAPHSGWVVFPFVYRGSNAAELPGFTAPRLMVVAVPPPSGVNFSDGVAVAVPTFCTTIVETPSREAFLAKYGA